MASMQGMEPEWDEKIYSLREHAALARAEGRAERKTLRAELAACEAARRVRRKRQRNLCGHTSVYRTAHSELQEAESVLAATRRDLAEAHARVAATETALSLSEGLLPSVIEVRARTGLSKWAKRPVTTLRAGPRPAVPGLDSGARRSNREPRHCGCAGKQLSERLTTSAAVRRRRGPDH